MFKVEVGGEVKVQVKIRSSGSGQIQNCELQCLYQAMRWSYDSWTDSKMCKKKYIYIYMKNTNLYQRVISD